MLKTIYLIQSQINDDYIYKIGITGRDITKRLSEIKTANPGKLTVLYLYPTKNATILEKSLHRYFEYCKISNEWFKNIELSTFIKTIEILDNSLTKIN